MRTTLERSEQCILCFAREAHRAELRLANCPLGTEIRAMVDGEFTWSQTCETVEELQGQLALIHDDFLSRRWSEVTHGSA
jgi:hypothetical protein